MAELRSVDPRTLKPNLNNPRRTPAPPAMDEQLVASIKAIGLIQPPVVREQDGDLVVKAGDRRVRAAIKADLASIDVIVSDSDETHVPMQSLSENLVRASINSVDIWRAIEALEKQGWSEPAIADALALPVRTVQRLKLLAHLHPPMLDVMAQGSMPSEDQLRTIAAAAQDEQAQVWKKHKPKKGHDVYWHDIARALSKQRMPFTAARFGDDLARQYGVVWLDDLFAPAGEESRYTTNVEGFFGAQQEWLQNNLPERGTLLPQNEWGRPVLPKKAEQVHGKPSKTDVVGHYLDTRSGEVMTVVYRMPPEKTKAKTDKPDAVDVPDAPEPKTRPDVTQRGNAMIGDFRTDALHQALKESAITDQTLIALLVLALAGSNVSVQSGAGAGPWEREAIRNKITEGGVITADDAAIRAAAREMLTTVLSSRDNMSNSGIGARIAGEAIGASAFLPTMATDEFLSCLSRQALERSAVAEGVAVEVRVKDTRARLVERFHGATWHYPGALFALTQEEVVEEAQAARYVPGHGGSYGDDDADEGAAPEDGLDDADDGDGVSSGQQDTAPEDRAVYADAAE